MGLHKKEFLIVLIKIALILYLLEGAIMVGFTLESIPDSYWKAFYDATLLTLVGTPLIAYFVIQPYVVQRDSIEADLRHNAFYDLLTELPNRNLLLEHIDQAIGYLNLSKENKFALVCLDIDNFKRINDSLGHAQGDKFLSIVGGRLKTSIRSFDTVARIGADEFVVILHNIRSLSEVKEVVCRILSRNTKMVQLGEYEVLPSLSAGILYVKRGGEYLTSAEVLRDADLALHRAKQKGKGRYEFFEKTMHDDMVNQFEVSNALRRGIENWDEFLCYFQPIIDTEGKKVLGMESLVRWNHPERGLLFPGSFIGIAEESDLIFNLGEMVIEKSCADFEKLCQAFPDARDWFLSINVSGRQLENSQLVSKFSECIEKNHLRPEQICMELTENILIARSEQASRVIQDVKSLGVKLSIDDFGTGYSSLNILSQLPLNTLKIDKSFVRNIFENTKNLELIKIMQLMGKELGFNLIIEGVENQAQFDCLRPLGIFGFQGHYFSEAIPYERLWDLLNFSLDVSRWPKPKLAGARAS